ncbi:hypothetical protein ES703_76899 [subsurface metagenome]
MTKPRTPLLSFGAQGTVADSLTFQKRGTGTMARMKPVPSQPRTLLQLYHRWDYQDGVFYWHSLTPAQKQAYQTQARPYHMTGFAYFMRYYLTNLPGLAGRWRLDEGSGITARDSSKNSNPGTIVGATWIKLPNSLFALSFDGLDDYVNLHKPSQLLNHTASSVILRIKTGSDITTLQYWFYGGYWTDPWGDYLRIHVGYFNIYLRNTAGNGVFIDIPVSTNTSYVLGYSWDGENVRFYLNGALMGTRGPFTGIISRNTIFNIALGGYTGQYKCLGVAKYLVIYDRGLSPAHMKSLSERSYP